MPSRSFDFRRPGMYSNYHKSEPLLYISLSSRFLCPSFHNLKSREINFRKRERDREIKKLVSLWTYCLHFPSIQFTPSSFSSFESKKLFPDFFPTFISFSFFLFLCLVPFPSVRTFKRNICEISAKTSPSSSSECTSVNQKPYRTHSLPVLQKKAPNDIWQPHLVI